MKPHVFHLLTLVMALLPCEAFKASAGVADLDYAADETIVAGPTAFKVSDISPVIETETVVVGPTLFETADIDFTLPAAEPTKHDWITPYALPYSRKCTGGENWGRMWANTGVLASAFVGTLVVLECLPEDATSWNRAALRQDPPLTRWYKHIFKSGPEWDHDLAIFNYVLHPYAGAAYFMSARSCGFSFWRSMLYSACVSTIGWEFGIEACMERPSYQDLVVTPVVGSLLGELFYKGKRTIVNNGDTLFGSWFLGRFACFFLDPVNEFIDLFRGRPASAVARAARERKVSGSLIPTANGVTLSITF